MRIWLIQRAESTPMDDSGQRRLMRMGVLANLLNVRGHEVVWWTSSFDHVSRRFRNSGSQKTIVKSGYEIRFIKSFGYKRNISLSRFIDNFYLSLNFRKELKTATDKPDIILASLPSAEMAAHAVKYAMTNSVPIFLDIRDQWPDLFKDYFPRYLAWIVDLLCLPMSIATRYACRNCTGVLGITDKFVDWGVRKACRPRSNKDVTFPMAYISGICTPFELDSAKMFWEGKGVKKSNTLYVLFLGSFSKSFDFAPIFCAAHDLNVNNVDLKFIFCGTGIQQEFIQEKCTELSNCIYGGWVNVAQIEWVLACSSIGITPYLDLTNFSSNIANKPAEYMSRGLVIANSLVSGDLTLLIEQNECGFSYAGDAKVLIKMLTELCGNKEKLSLMKENAKRAFSEGYDGNDVYNELVSFMEGQAGLNNIAVTETI